MNSFFFFFLSELIVNRILIVFLIKLSINFQRRCIYKYKCLNGLVERYMNFIRQQGELDYNTRTKLNFRHPSVKRNRLE